MYISKNSYATLFGNAEFINESNVCRKRVQAMDVFEYNTFKEGQWVKYAPGNVKARGGLFSQRTFIRVYQRKKEASLSSRFYTLFKFSVELTVTDVNFAT